MMTSKMPNTSKAWMKKRSIISLIYSYNTPNALNQDDIADLHHIEEYSEGSSCSDYTFESDIDP
jgi:hypothetical protein